MKILITGICGFVGSRLGLALKERIGDVEIVGIDNLLRAGAEGNRANLAAHHIKFIHGDLRMRSDVEGLPACDWVIDAAAHPSVMAGIDGKSSPRQLSEHNLSGTINILEYCRERAAGLLLLSTSRVYSIRELASVPIKVVEDCFTLDVENGSVPRGTSKAGITEQFPVSHPISLYGATKLSSETMAIEYGMTFDFPVWINRCGVLAGAGQFGTAEQGIFSYWLHAHAARLPLRYIGFGGSGYQVRDAFHPEDLADLIAEQFRRTPPADAVYNLGGGERNALSLARLTAWCDDRFGRHEPEADKRERPFDIPWLIMDYGRAAKEFDWAPRRTLPAILDEIADHVHENPGWLVRCGVI